MQLSLTVLGSSSALPLSNRFPSSQFLTLSNRHFLIDCGEGAQMQLRRNRIGFARINHIMISHLHGDHIYGLLPLLTTLHLLDRQKELHIYAPAELEKNIEDNLRLSHARLKFPLIFHPLNMAERDLIYEDKAVRVFSFPMRHSLPCCGFLFEEKPRPRKVIKDQVVKHGIPGPEVKAIKEGGDWENDEGEVIPNDQLTRDAEKSLSYAYCSDTAYLPNLPELLGLEPDVLYHEATFRDEHARRASQTKHSTARQAGMAARNSGAKNLLVGHFSTRYENLDDLRDEAREEFDNSYLALENWQYVLKSGEKLVAQYNLD